MQRNKVIWIGIAIILVFTPIGRGTVKIWSIAPVLPIALLVFIWLWRVNNRIKDSGLRIKGTSLDKPILALAALAVISFVFSIYKHDSFYALLRLFAYAGIFYLIVNNYSHGFKRYLIGLVICIGTGLSIYGLLQYFGFFPHSWWSPKDFLAATYVNHNHFAGYLELVIPVAVGALIGIKNYGLRIKVTLIAAVIIMLTAFIFAQSRGAWISLAISLILMSVILVKRQITSKKSVTMVILLIALVFSFAYIKSDLVSGRGEASFRTRLEIWQGSIEMIRQNPLIGTGIGTFVWAFPRYRPEGLDLRVHFAHNDYLHMTGEMGLLALPIMIMILVRVIGAGISQSRKPLYDPVILGCATGMLSLSLHGLVDFNFHIPANMILFTIFAALIMNENQTEERGLC